MYYCIITYTFIQKSSVLLSNGLKSPHAQQDEKIIFITFTQSIHYLPKIVPNILDKVWARILILEPSLMKNVCNAKVI